MHCIHSIALILTSWVAATTALPSRAWPLKSFKTLVTFGDSYTDESRLNYFASHNGSAPPVGWIDPIVSVIYYYLLFDTRDVLPLHSEPSTHFDN